ncbi:HAD family hydrolase [Vibrio ziniensis]|uniref:HAD family phosphatase n=1 Tax=Vibrio ziniensis TaxID=2711221 RepID=A0A6G7CP16_9VIBR|nr:HAD family hydrolase [Vibrio ziniensis]QIH43768.1 HAD family phosphatase [Vibrio ziniensis]
MIKLIITDMDGTFLNSQGDYNRDLFKNVVAKMGQQGVHFAPCTGKQVERVEELLGEESKKFWILGDSATRIKYQGEYIYQSLLNNKLGRDIIQQLEAIAGSHIVIACTPEFAAIKKDTPEHLRDLVRRSYANVKLVESYQEIESDFVKITVYDENKQCPALRPQLSPFDEKAYIVVSEAAWIDIANAGVHKGTTVERLQEILNVTQAETMVFGDGFNDIELMERAHFSFAMRNAFEETKAAANYITRSNDEDGVMHTILQFLSLQSKV